jgi:hypothetical protein
LYDSASIAAKPRRIEGIFVLRKAALGPVDCITTQHPLACVLGGGGWGGCLSHVKDVERCPTWQTHCNTKNACGAWERNEAQAKTTAYRYISIRQCLATWHVERAWGSCLQISGFRVCVLNPKPSDVSSNLELEIPRLGFTKHFCSQKRRKKNCYIILATSG